MSQQTPPQVAQTAAQPDVLPLRELTLIGLFSGPQGNRALLRSGRGQIAEVSAGDAAFGHTVAAVAESHVMLTNRMGQTFSIQMPGD